MNYYNWHDAITIFHLVWVMDDFGNLVKCPDTDFLVGFITGVWNLK